MPGVPGVFELEPARYLRRLPTRETFIWAGSEPAPDRDPDMDREMAPDSEPEGERVVIKRSRGAAWPERLNDLLNARAPRSPGRREYENLRQLADAGLPVPRALAWCAEGPTFAGRSAVIMAFVPHARDLREHLASTISAAQRRALLGRLVGLVVRLHGSGWYHRDLYLQHVAVVPAEGPGAATGLAGELVLLDVGRARHPRRPPRRRWFVKDLAALLHSTPTSVSAPERLRFLAAYLEGRGLGAAGRRRWARSVLAKARRMAAHVPRHGETEPAARTARGTA